MWAHGVEVVVVFYIWSEAKGGRFYLRISRNLSHFFCSCFFFIHFIHYIYVSPVGFCKGAWSYGVLSVYLLACCVFGELVVLDGAFVLFLQQICISCV
jgi:hypothetical protein